MKPGTADEYRRAGEHWFYASCKTTDKHRNRELKSKAIECFQKADIIENGPYRLETGAIPVVKS